MPRVKRGTKRRDYRHKTLARASTGATNSPSGATNGSYQNPLEPLNLQGLPSLPGVGQALPFSSGITPLTSGVPVTVALDSPDNQLEPFQ